MVKYFINYELIKYLIKLQNPPINKGFLLIINSTFSRPVSINALIANGLPPPYTGVQTKQAHKTGYRT